MPHTLPYSDAVFVKCLGCAISCAIGLACISWALATFYRFQRQLDSVFNRLLVAFFVLDGCLAGQRFVFSVVTIANRGLPFKACDTNASLEQLFGYSSLCLLLAFFVSMANPLKYCDSSTIVTTALAAAATLGWLSLAAMWVIVGTRNVNRTAVGEIVSLPYFDQSLAWCWIPGDAKVLQLAFVSSDGPMKGLRLFLGYLPALIGCLAAMYAYAAQRCQSGGERWLHDRVIVRRFVGVTIFPTAIAVCGMIARLDNEAENNPTVSAVLSALYPLQSVVMSLNFLWTEDAFGWLPRSLFGGGDIMRKGSHQRRRQPDPSPRSSSLYTPWIAGTDAAPRSFTASIRAMTCNLVAGSLVMSSTMAISQARFSEAGGYDESNSEYRISIHEASHREQKPQPSPQSSQMIPLGALNPEVVVCIPGSSYNSNRSSISMLSAA